MSRPASPAGWHRRAAAAAIVAAAAAWIVASAASAPRKPDLSVEVLDVGQGDAILIRSPEGKTALIDAGPGKHIAALLKQKRVTTIDLLVLTHHHADHYGGMAEVIKDYAPRVFLASNSSHTTPGYLKLLQHVRDAGIRAIQPGPAARRIGLGSAVLTVLPQPPEDTQDENDNSIGIRLDYGDFSALLTGDSQGPARAYWLRTCPALVRDCTVLKLAHHGSRNGTDARWLDATRPEMAVASLGATNDYGHPHPETLSLLGRRKVPLLRTDLVGTVSFVSDGATWDVTTARPGRSEAASSRGRDRDDATARASARIDLNTATEAELMGLPGVSATVARRVVERRPYRSVDDLRSVRGIGAEGLAELRPRVVVR